MPKPWQPVVVLLRTLTLSEPLIRIPARVIEEAPLLMRKPLMTIQLQLSSRLMPSGVLLFRPEITTEPGAAAGSARNVIGAAEVPAVGASQPRTNPAENVPASAFTTSPATTLSAAF